MRTWVIEIRDHATCIPALAIHMYADTHAQAYWIHGRCGHPRDGSGLCLMKLNDAEAHFDPYEWVHNRTMRTAHLWIMQHMDELEIDGAVVVDVRVILGETESPAISEREEFSV